jgi:hypothetical protein
MPSWHHRRTPPLPPATAVSSPASLVAVGAVRLARTVHIKRGRTPLIRSTMDRWTKYKRRSTGHVNLVSSLHQPGHSQLSTWRHLNFPAGRPGNFANKPPISGIYKNILPPYKRALPFSGLDPRFSNLSNPRSMAALLHLNPPSFIHN